jgi:outer membrane receptor protein involved in Fe transport
LLASYFDLKQENVTEVDPNKPPSPVWYRQIPGVRSQGFEFSANARLARDWRCIVGYSYTDARDESPGPNYGCRRDTVPRNKLTVYNNFNGSRGFLKNWSAGCGVIYTGSRPVQEVGGRGNEVDWGPVAAVWRVDASLGYRWHLGGPVRQMAVSLRVKNLFDNTDMFYYMRYNRYTVDPGRECQFVWDVRF